MPTPQITTTIPAPMLDRGVILAGHALPISKVEEEDGVIYATISLPFSTWTHRFDVDSRVTIKIK